jgi:hypothetical protein
MVAAMVTFVPRGIYFCVRGNKSTFDYWIGGYLVDRSRSILFKASVFVLQSVAWFVTMFLAVFIWSKFVT